MNLKNYGGHFDLESKKEDLKKYQLLSEQENFWEDQKKAQDVLKKKNLLEEKFEEVKTIEDLFSGLELYEDLLKEDPEAQDLMKKDFFLLKKTVLDLRQKVLLGQEEDALNAIVTIQAGAGGTEACDWAGIIQRMVLRWVEKKHFKIQPLDEQEGDGAGIKSCSFIVQGSYAYGLLKSESGIHRLVRISPFDSGARRHTSFASIYVSPEIEDNIEIKIEEKDLRIDVYRSGGAGGQSVNTTDSAVRITHLPTKIVVTCQNERSQIQNKAMAMKILRSKLHQLALEEKNKKKNLLESEKKEIGWGSQIRSYVLHPYKMVKDHRTDLEDHNPDDVLDGYLDHFIAAYLEWSQS